MILQNATRTELNLENHIFVFYIDVKNMSNQKERLF